MVRATSSYYGNSRLRKQVEALEKGVNIKGKGVERSLTKDSFRDFSILEYGWCRLSGQ